MYSKVTSSSAPTLVTTLRCGLSFAFVHASVLGVRLLYWLSMQTVQTRPYWGEGPPYSVIFFPTRVVIFQTLRRLMFQHFHVYAPSFSRFAFASTIFSTFLTCLAHVIHSCSSSLDGEVGSAGKAARLTCFQLFFHPGRTSHPGPPNDASHWPSHPPLRHYVRCLHP